MKTNSEKIKNFGRLSIILLMFILLVAQIGFIVRTAPFVWADGQEQTSGFDINVTTLVRYTGNATTITIPVQIDTIAAGAFRDNTTVVDILLNANTVKIEQNAFYGCTNLKNFTIPSGSKLKEIGYMAFARCGMLREISLPDTVEKIGDFAFFADASLRELLIPNNVKTIGKYAFMSCVNISSFIIPASVQNIGIGAFNYCISNTEIRVDSANLNYSSSNGVLYSKDQKTLVRYPSGKRSESYITLTTTKQIEQMAFWDNRYLISLNLSDNLEFWAEGAINDRSENTILNTISAPNKQILKQSQTEACKYCPNLTVTYR